MPDIGPLESDERREGRRGRSSPPISDAAKSRSLLGVSIVHPGGRERLAGATSRVELRILNARDRIEVVPLSEDNLMLLLEQASKCLRILRRDDA